MSPTRSPHGSLQLALLLLCLGLLATPAAGAPTAQQGSSGDDATSPCNVGSTVDRSIVVMATAARIRVEAASAALAGSAAAEAIAALRAAEGRLSTWDAVSPLSRLNRSPVGVAQDLRSLPDAGLLTRELSRAWQWRDRTGRAFDPVLGAHVEAHGLRAESGGVPASRAARSSAARGTAAEGSGASGITVNFEHGQWTRRVDGAWVDAGGFGKGAGLDAALAAVRGAAGPESGVLLDLGGQLLWSFGGSAADRALTFGVADPSHRDVILVEVSVGPEGSLATSGGSERPGHLLDPRSGTRARDFGSLTVLTSPVAGDVAALGIDADCLSTGLYVLGPDAALAFAERTPGVDVLVIERVFDAATGAHSARRIRASQGLRSYHRLPLLPNDADGSSRPAVPPSPHAAYAASRPLQ